MATDEEEQRLFDLINREQIRIFYTRIPACFGVINPDAEDPPATDNP